MKPTINSLWKYYGPDVHNENGHAPKYQIHKVIFSHAGEIITIGIPAGHGGTWMGDAQEFQEHFKYVGEASETSC